MSEDDSMSIKCDYGTIKITSASYYSNDSDCQKNVKSVLGSKCNYHYKCTITSSNGALGGDPCRHHEKTLSFEFICE